MGYTMLESIAPSAKSTAVGAGARHWWQADTSDEAALLMLLRAKRIANEQAEDREDMRLFASFATGRRLSSLYHYAASKTNTRDWDYLGHRVTWNLVGACLETAEARIAKARTRIKIQTFGGDWNLWQRSRNMGRWIDGAFDQTRYYRDVARPVFRDATIFRGGIAKVCHQRDEGVVPERVMPFEILVDDSEGIRGMPSTAYHVSVLPRTAVEDAWGNTEERKQLIAAAPSVDAGEHRGDVIEVIEGWHINGKKGRRIVAISPAGCLVDEDWKLPRLPLSKYLYLHNPAGFWGRGMVAGLVGTQIEINTLLAKVREAHKKMAGSHWAVPIGSTVTAGQLVNEQGSTIEFAGPTPPVSMLVSAMPPEVYQHLERLWSRGFELSGLSELSASGEKPVGINSGTGLRELEDQQGQRFGIPQEEFEELTRDVADLMISVARIAYANDKDAMIAAPSSKLLEKIRWGDADMKEDQFKVRAAAANILPTLPGARIEKILEMRDSGAISAEAAQAMLGLDVSDVEGIVNPGAEQWEEACRAITRILDTGKYEAPDEILDPVLGLTIGSAMYLRAKGDGAPDEALGAVLQWCDDCKAIARQTMQANQPAAAPEVGGAPAAPPMPGMDPSAGMGPPPGNRPEAVGQEIPRL